MTYNVFGGTLNLAQLNSAVTAATLVNAGHKAVINAISFVICFSCKIRPVTVRSCLMMLLITRWWSCSRPRCDFFLLLIM